MFTRETSYRTYNEAQDSQDSQELLRECHAMEDLTREPGVYSVEDRPESVGTFELGVFQDEDEEEQRNSSVSSNESNSRSEQQNQKCRTTSSPQRPGFQSNTVQMNISTQSSSAGNGQTLSTTHSSVKDGPCTRCSEQSGPSDQPNQLSGLTQLPSQEMCTNCRSWVDALSTINRDLRLTRTLRKWTRKLKRWRSERSGCRHGKTSPLSSREKHQNHSSTMLPLDGPSNQRNDIGSTQDQTKSNTEQLTSSSTDLTTQNKSVP